MSDLMRTFLRDWLDWVEAGAPQNKPFDRNMGLCASTELYGCNLVFELARMFREDGLHYEFPFNNGKIAQYIAEQYTVHENPKRLAWVRSKLQEHADA